MNIDSSSGNLLDTWMRVLYTASRGGQYDQNLNMINFDNIYHDTYIFALFLL